MAKKKESGSGPHCEGSWSVRVRTVSKEGDRSPKNRPGERVLREATEWDRILPTFLGENASPGPTGLGGKARGFASESRTGNYC